MKKTIFGLMMVMLMSLLTNAITAQRPTAKPRDLFIEKEKDESKGKSGAKVRILLKRGAEKERYVAPTETFYSGDKIKLAFDINFSGYVALLNVGSSGKITMLYPYPGVDAMVEPSDKEQLIPANSKDWIAFDSRPGSEQITIIFSTNPIQSVQQIIEMSGQNNTSDNSSTVSGSAGATVNITNTGNGSAIYVAASARAQAILEELNARSLKRSKTRDLYVETVNNDATYVLAESSLISEPTAFVITLKHESKN
jgi:hypothetical protein